MGNLTHASSVPTGVKHEAAQYLIQNPARAPDTEGCQIWKKSSGRLISLPNDLEVTILWFVRSQVPQSMTGFFSAVTWTGSAGFLVPASVLAVVVLLAARRRFEALLMAASMVTAPLAVYGLKSALGRPRPDLWDAPWYWGSSFPSGHTLSTTAFAVASVLCASRIWPQRRGWVMAAAVVAVLWTIGVALSRLVIGAHWPTDVLASLGLGLAIPLFFNVLFDLYQGNRLGKK